jgi:drug/metabolite transporter (DMT)-like permease
MLGVVLAALCALAYGASDFSGAVASKRTSAMVVTAAAQTVSLISLVAVLVVIPGGERRAVDLAWAGLGGLGVAVALVCFYRALAIGPMSVAAATTSLVGALVPIGFGLALGDRPGAVALAGMAIAVPAVVLVSSAGSGARSSGGPGLPREQAFIARAPMRRRDAPPLPRERAATLRTRSPGTTRALSFVAGLGFGVFFVALSRTSADAGLFPLLGARGASIAALAIVLSASSGWERIDRPAWPAVAVTGVLDCAANALYLSALDHGELSWVAAISSLYPVSTVLLARVVLAERLSRPQAIGMAMAGAAMALVAWGR